MIGRKIYKKKLEVQNKNLTASSHAHLQCVCVFVLVCVCVLLVYELIILKKFYNKLINHNNRNHCALYA